MTLHCYYVLVVTFVCTLNWGIGCNLKFTSIYDITIIEGQIKYLNLSVTITKTHLNLS